MATKTIYHIEIDHYEKIANGQGTLVDGKTFSNSLVMLVLKRGIFTTEVETGDSSDTYAVDITGGTNYPITLFAPSGGMDYRNDYIKATGLDFTNSYTSYEYMSPDNQYVPGGYRSKLTVSGSSLFGYSLVGELVNPDLQERQDINIKNYYNAVEFEDGYSWRGQSRFSNANAVVLYREKDDLSKIGTFGFTYRKKEFDDGSVEYYDVRVFNDFFLSNGSTESGILDVFLINGEQISLRRFAAHLLGGTKIDTQPDVKPGQSGGQSTSGSTSGSDWPYQYPSYGTGSAGGAGEGIFGGDGTHKKWGGSVTENDIIANNPDPVKSGDISSIWGLEHIENKGGVRIFDLSTDDLGTLYGKLWDNDFITSLNKYQAGNIGNTIIKLYQSKIAPEILGERKIYLGSFDSTIRTNQCKEYVHRKLGTFQVLEFFGSFLDYKTKLQIFLPFCGFQDLMADKYISPTHAPRTITVFIDADMVSGVAVYNVKTTYSDGQAIIDTFPFDFSRELPIIESSFANAQSAVNQILAGTVAVGTSALVGLFGPESMALGALTGFAGGAAQLGTGLGSLNRPTYTVSGGAGKNFGFLQADKIYLLAFRPVCTVPENSSHYIGYQSRITKKIGDIKKGTFNKMQSVLLDENIPSDIAGEIDNILTTGFYT